MILVGIGLLFAFASMACLTWALWPDMRSRLVRQRMYHEINVDERPTLLSQLAQMLEPMHRFLPTGWYSTHMRRRLEAAGKARMQPLHFLVLQEMGMIAGLTCYLLMRGLEHVNVGWLALFLAGGFFVPYLWLSSAIQTRRQSISRDLPELVDLLSLCVDAGMDFMNALGRVVKEFRPCSTTEELGIAIQEVRVGKRRRDALRAFSSRVQTPEASSFSRTLIQADRMGTGISEALRILSEDMRIQRYNWAERFAQQAPVKMLLPLLFSLASALIIVAGPILMQFLKGGFSVSNYSAGAQSEQ